MFRFFHNSWPNRQRGEEPPPDTGPNYFDFAVSTSHYTRGSGPPLSVPTPSAESKHNQDGTIIEFIPGAADRVPRFIVGSTVKPGLRVAVNIIDILDWVSARTFEEWNFQQTKQERRQARLEGMHWKARQKLEQDREGASTPRDKVETELGIVKNEGHIAQDSIVQKKRGRPFNSTKKKPPIVEQASPGRVRRRISSQVEALALQPSLASQPRQHRDFAELTITGSSDETDGNDQADLSEDIEMVDDNTQLGLELQLNGDRNFKSGSRKRSRFTPDPVGMYNGDYHLQHSNTLSSYKAVTTILQNDMTSIIGRNNDSTPSSSKTSIAQSISRSSPISATKIAAPRQKLISSFILPGQKLSSKAKKSSASKKTPSLPPPSQIETVDERGADEEREEEGKDSEWEVDSIVTHELRTNDDGINTFFYWLKWKGDWGNTWEPRENISPDLVKEYHDALRPTASTEVNGKMKRLKDRKRRREEEERKDNQKRRSTRSISRATTAETEEGRARKRPSRSPAVVSYKYHDNENLFDLDDNDDDLDDDDDDVGMPDVRRRSKSKSVTKSRSGMMSREDTKSREGTASSGLFISERIAPVANMFGPSTKSKINCITDIKDKGEEVVRRTIELEPPERETPRVDKGKGKVIEILSSGEESGSEDDNDELA